MVSVSEKAVLRVSDLLDWIGNPVDIEWDRGSLGVCHDDCSSKPFTYSKTTKKENSSSNGGGEDSPESPSKENIPIDSKNKPKKKNSSESESSEGDIKSENVGKLPPGKLLPGGVKPPNDNSNLSAKFSPGYHEFLNDIKKEQEMIGK